MVWMSKCFFSSVVNKPIRRYLKGRFIDTLRLYVRGGAGGMGYPKFGGIGGKGGDVYIIAKEGETLKSLIKKYPLRRIKAENGENSRAKCILGQPGKDVHVDVPVGIIIIDEQGRKIGELNENGSKCLVAQGSPGGCPQSGFNGKEGIANTITLDLRLIADVGLVGFPNAGKSSLLRAISRATPKVASYPFTTLQPEIGVVTMEDDRRFTVADLPGIVEGAHINIGLGHKFLKHIERTRVLLFVVDIFGFALSPHHVHRSCLDTVILLNKELELYREDLLDKPAVLVINKLDLPLAKDRFEYIKEDVKNLPEIAAGMPEEFRPKKIINFEYVLGLSAKEGKTPEIELLKKYLRDTMEWVYVEGHGEYSSGTYVDDSGHVKWEKDSLSRKHITPEEIYKKISERGKRFV